MIYNLRNYPLAIAALLIITAPIDAANAGEVLKSNNVVKIASVNGTIVSQEQFDRSMIPIQKQVAAMGEGAVSDEQMKQVKTRVLENLIANELLYQESQKSGIEVEEKEINEAYDSQKARFETDAEFQDALKQSKFSETTFREQIRLGLAIQHFIDKKFAQNTIISDEEAKKYYDENPDEFEEPAKVRASHIMILAGSDASQSEKDEAKRKIESALKRLKAGEDFAAIAKEVSQDSYSKENGGDLNYFSKGAIDESFEEAAFALKVGEVSGIVETPYGYHIIKLTDKIDARKISYEESKDNIKNTLFSNKVNSDVDKYVADLRSKASVEIFFVQ